MTWVTCGVCGDPRAAPPGVEAMRRTADLKAWTAATKSAGQWEKALAMSMAMAPGVETWTWRRWKTLRDVERRWKTLAKQQSLGKDWKRLKKAQRGKSQCWHGERSGPENRASRTSSDFCSCAMPLQSFRQKKFPFVPWLSHGCPMVVPWLSHGCTGLLVFRNQMQRIRWFCLVPWETGKFSLPSCRWAEGCFVIKVSGWRHANFHNGTVRQEKNGINERPTEVLWYVMVVTLEKHGCMSFWNTVGRWSAWFGCPKSQNSKQRRLWRVEKAGQWRRSRWSRMAAEVPA